MKNRPEPASLTTRKLYAVAAQWFPSVIERYTITELQQSAMAQIVGGRKHAAIWAREYGVSKDFAYALIVTRMKDEIEEAERVRRTESQRKANFAMATVYAR